MHPHMALMALDSTITLLNAAIVGERHRLLTRWFMGDPVTVEEFWGTGPLAGMPLTEDQKQLLARILSDQSAI